MLLIYQEQLWNEETLDQKRRKVFWEYILDFDILNQSQKRQIQNKSPVFLLDNSISLIGRVGSHPLNGETDIKDAQEIEINDSLSLQWPEKN